MAEAKALNMASKTQFLLLLVAVMITSYNAVGGIDTATYEPLNCTTKCITNGTFNCTNNCTANGTFNCTNNCTDNGIAACLANCMVNVTVNCTNNCTANGTITCTVNGLNLIYNCTPGINNMTSSNITINSTTNNGTTNNSTTNNSTTNNSTTNNSTSWTTPSSNHGNSIAPSFSLVGIMGLSGLLLFYATDINDIFTNLHMLVARDKYSYVIIK
ncbi:uncharacterized protein omgb [Danio rerio]|uniref:Uncharacterized protein omgb n=1 Tax=Danio rerio TaxID=7955 RepID=A0AB40E5W1_DANRE